MNRHTNVNPISVCFVSPKAYGLFDPSVQTNFGGAEVDLYMLATELAKDPAFSVSFITADYGQPAELVLENVRLLKSLDFNKNPLDGAFRIWRALKKADAQLCLIKTASAGVPLVSAFCRLRHRRFLYRTAHRRECDGTYRKDHPILGRLFNRSLRRATCVFAQNQEDQDSLLQTTGVHSVVIPNGHRINPPAAVNRNSILWVGRSAGFKHPQRLLELAGRFPNERFVMICRPATGDRKYGQFQKEAAAVQNLEFHTNADFFKMDAYFDAAKVLVNTSDAEGFPNTFIQAAKAGAAILTWKVNPDQFLTQYQCGLACGGSMDKLTEGLAFLLENRRYIEIGQNGVNYCREHHDISKLAELYKEHFRRITAAGAARPE